MVNETVWNVETRKGRKVVAHAVYPMTFEVALKEAARQQRLWKPAAGFKVGLVPVTITKGE